MSGSNTQVICQTFTSGREHCTGRLYLPAAVDPPPVVVMGHGLGALQTFRLQDYARRFVERGLAVFTFDYRHWGESSGEPRHWLSPQRQLEDWQAAVDYVRRLEQVDGGRLAVWGSSFSGAHVIHLAARDRDIAALVALVPAADTGAAIDGVGAHALLKAVGLAVLDSLRSLLGMSPLYMPIVGRPGETAMLTTPECWDGYWGLVPDDSPWQNRITARSVLRVPGYRAVKIAREVAAPTLLVAGRYDSLVRIEDVRNLARLMPDATLKEYDCNHFEPYYSPMLDTLAREQAEFLVRQLTFPQE